jgi:hypothetical protein
MSPPMRTWLRHTAVLVAILAVATIAAGMLGYDRYLPLWASLPGLILVVATDYVGTVGIPGRREDEPPRDEPDAVG